MMIAVTEEEFRAIGRALIHGLESNIFDYAMEKAVKNMLKAFYPNEIVKRGIPTKMGKDLKT